MDVLAALAREIMVEMDEERIRRKKTI